MSYIVYPMDSSIIVTGITLEEFKALIKDEVREEIQNALNGQKENFSGEKQPESDCIMTRKEASTFLNISLTTLDNWTKKGIIPKHRINTSIRYKKSDIENLLKQQ